MTDFKDRDEIIEVLRSGLHQSDPVPPVVAEFAAALFSWRDIDAELAELAFDSIDEDVPAGVRSSTAERMVSFEVGRWNIDLEYNEDTRILLGSISPEANFTVELHRRGALSSAECDELGRFRFEDVARGPASLVVRFPDGSTVKTTWIVL